MKIALVLSAPPGYSETFFNFQIKGLKENGHDVTLFTGNSSLQYDFCKHRMHPTVNKFRVLQIFLMIYRGFTLLPNFKAVKTYIHLERKQGTPIRRVIEKIYINASLLKFKGDWVHYGFATVALGRELVPQAIGAKMAVSFRGYDINVYPLKHDNCYNLLWQQVDKVHSISTYLLNKSHNLGLDKNIPFQVIYPAVDLNLLPKSEEKEAGTKLRIVTIARFSWIKGLEMLTEVALQLKKQGIEFEWSLIGAGDDHEKERYLYDVSEKQLEQLNNIGQSSHEDTLKILQKSDVYVQTSLNEGFCNALLEAQAMGIPCVAFNVGGIPENVVDNKTGWLIDSFNTTAMAQKIHEILHLSVEHKRRMSQKSMERVRKDFNLDKQKEVFNEFYRF